MKKAIFLDRDNTIIVDKIYLNDPEQIEYLPNVFESLKQLYDAGYIFIVVTNQSGVPRGLVQEENIAKIHQRIQNRFKEHDMEITDFYYAPHLPESGHPWRKPGTGMLDQAQKEHNIDFQQSWMVGDRMTDIEAGHRAGCQTVLLKITKEEASPFDPPEHIIYDFKELGPIVLSK